MRLVKHGLSVAIVFGLNSMNAIAQSSGFDRFNRETGPEARLTLTIPIGPETRTTKDKSRLEFGVRQYQDRSNDINWALNQNAQIYGDDFDESRIGFTLSENPSLMLNGQEWQVVETQLDINGDDVGVGLAVVTGVVVIGIVTLCATSGCIPFTCDVDEGECS